MYDAGILTVLVELMPFDPVAGSAASAMVAWPSAVGWIAPP